MFSGRVHGSNGKLSVKMSLSERMPGYRNRSQVPPIRCPSFQHRVGQLRILLVDAVRGADPRDAGADDQHVGVFGLLGPNLLFAQALIGHP